MAPMPRHGSRTARSRSDASWRRRLRVAAVLIGIALAGSVTAGGISILDDLDVGVWSPFGTRWEAESAVCVTGDGAFRVTAASLDRPDRFVLDNGVGDEVPYQVFWRNRDAPGRGEGLSPGSPSRKAVSGDARTGCGGGANARIRIRVDRRAIDRAPPGIYGDTLLLTLSPL